MEIKDEIDSFKEKLESYSIAELEEAYKSYNQDAVLYDERYVSPKTKKDIIETITLDLEQNINNDEWRKIERIYELNDFIRIFL